MLCQGKFWQVSNSILDMATAKLPPLILFMYLAFLVNKDGMIEANPQN